MQNLKPGAQKITDLLEFKDKFEKNILINIQKKGMELNTKRIEQGFTKAKMLKLNSTIK